MRAARRAVRLEQGDAGTEQVIVVEGVHDGHAVLLGYAPDRGREAGQVVRVHEVRLRAGHELVQPAGGERQDVAEMVSDSPGGTGPPVTVVEDGHGPAAVVRREGRQDLDVEPAFAHAVRELRDVALGAARELVCAVRVDQQQTGAAHCPTPPAGRARNSLHSDRAVSRHE